MFLELSVNQNWKIIVEIITRSCFVVVFLRKESHICLTNELLFISPRYNNHYENLGSSSSCCSLMALDQREDSCVVQHTGLITETGKCRRNHWVEYRDLSMCCQQQRRAARKQKAPAVWGITAQVKSDWLQNNNNKTQRWTLLGTWPPGLNSGNSDSSKMVLCTQRSHIHHTYATISYRNWSQTIELQWSE